MRGSKAEIRPGVWRLRVYVGLDPVTGRKRHASRTFNGTTRHATTALSAFVAEVSKGNHGGPSTITVAGLLDAYTQHAENVGRSPTTVAEYRRQVDTLRDGIGRKQLAKLRGEDLDELYAILSTTGIPGGHGAMAPASVRRYHALMSAALHQAVKWGWIERNPAERATAPRPPRPKTTSPAPAELHRLIDGAAAISPAHGILLALAAMTGARRGELCALRWSDVDLDAGVIHFRRSIKQVGQRLIEGDTKTHSERSIALPSEAVDQLRRYRDGLKHLADDPFVFSPTPDHSKPYVPGTISRMVIRVAREAGLPYHLHQLRHFAATQAIGAGFDAVTVSKRLGHADPSMTLRVYAHALEERDRAAGDFLGALVLPPGSRK